MAVAPSAGFWIRFLAAVIDGTLLSVAALGLEMLFDLFLGLTPFMFQVVNVGVYLLLGIPYYVWAQFRWGATPGKLLVNVRVVDATAFAQGMIQLPRISSLWIRYVSYLISYLPMGSGFLMAAIHPNKQALHELLSSTRSIRSKQNMAK